MKIAISGKSGCGNSTVSRIVADRLGFRLVNYTFHSIADEIGISFAEMCELAERDSTWDRYVDRRQVEMAQAGDTVLGSRLAIWVLDDADLRVYLDAPLEIRARRIHRREGGDLDVVMEETARRDERDHHRYLELYGIDNNDFSFADLVINTHDLTPGQIADEIIKKAPARMSHRG